MMNKLHMLALAGLMFSGINNASMMGQEQMQILYALHTFGQDYSQVPVIVQNIDMFYGVAEMSVQLKELELKNATKELKNVLLRNAALFAGTVVSKALFSKFLQSMGSNRAYSYDIKNLLNISSYSLSTTMSVLNGLNIYDAWKKRSELVKALELDREILSKLQEIKFAIDSAPSADNSMSAESILLGNAAESALVE